MKLQARFVRSLQCCMKSTGTSRTSVAARRLSSSFRAAATAVGGAGSLAAAAAQPPPPSRFFLDLVWVDSIAKARVIVALPPTNNPFVKHAAALLTPVEGGYRGFAVDGSDGRAQQQQLSLNGAVMLPNDSCSNGNGHNDTTGASSAAPPIMLPNDSCSNGNGHNDTTGASSAAPPSEMRAVLADNESIAKEQLHWLQEYEEEMETRIKNKNASRHHHHHHHNTTATTTTTTAAPAAIASEGACTNAKSGSASPAAPRKAAPVGMPGRAAGTLAIELDSDGSPGATRAAGGVVVGAVIDGIEFLQDAKGPALQITSCGPVVEGSARPGEQSEGVSATSSSSRGKIYGYTMYE
eukprot:gene847-7320_t